MAVNVLTPAIDMTRAEWLEARRKGIGGSDAAAIVAESMEAPSWSGLKDGTVGRRSQVKRPTGAQSWRTWWPGSSPSAQARGCAGRAACSITQYPFMLANIDRLVVGEPAGLECKTTGENKHEWGDDGEIPPEYLPVMHYMAVTGFSTTYGRAHRATNSSGSEWIETRG